ncbi:MAG: hypothetical protein JXX14_16100 [Deltaproteobacteria bacterium]|nr:hypothetical protein [Deltaproteobacteria bacterium]
MIYCPSCKKPSAKSSGNCPHCGVALGSPAAPQKKTVASNQSSPRPPAESLRYGGADIEMDDSEPEDEMPLELAGADSNAPSPRPTAPGLPSAGAIRISAENMHPPPVMQRAFSITEAATASKVQEIAQFGQCDTGIIGVMKYGFRVYQRLPALKQEAAASLGQKENAWETLEQAKSRLGRLAHRNNLSDAQLQRIVAEAVKADGKLDDIQKQENHLDAQYQGRYAIFDQRRSAVELEMAPIQEEAERRKSVFEQMSKERARLKAKIKRSEIELRNARELIEKKQVAYADLNRPKEERTRLLKDIAEVDNRQPALLNRLSAEQKELDGTEAPFEAISSRLRETEARLGEFNHRLAEIKKERAQIEAEHKAALDEIHHRVKGESKQAQAAWAAVGEMVYVNKLLSPEHLTDVAAAAQQFFKAQENHNLYEEALNSYDKGACEMAKKYWIATAVISGTLLLILAATAMF